MTKEEIKQWVRNQIDNSLKIQHKYNKNIFHLYYNKSYIRALKLSTITGFPVIVGNFDGGEELFYINPKNKIFWHCDIIDDYLIENYSKNYSERQQIIKEVITDYEEYKDYNYIW